MAESGRRGFFSRLTSLFQEADPITLRPEWKPAPLEAEAPTGAATIVRQVVRPPGALPEARFLTACTRCGACVDACPEHAIAADAQGYPKLAPEQQPCILCADVPCASACPTDVGALVPGPIRIGFARVFDKLCINHHEADACERCRDWCPVPGAIQAGPRGIPMIVSDVCTGCGACANHCAAYPRAIGVRPS